MTNNNMIPAEMTRDELKSEYDAIAGEYERRMWFDQSILGVARLRRQLMSKARGKILDVACGTGLNFPLFTPGSDITGIDLSPGMLEVARQNASRLGLNIHLAVMDAQKLDFAEGSFDTIVSSLSTCTFPDPLGALREMQRVCRTDGRILLLEHGRSKVAWLARIQDRCAGQHYHENAGCRWNQEPLELIQAAGMKVLSSKRSVLGVFHSMEAAPGLRRSRT